jgi:alpha-glucosidase
VYLLDTARVATYYGDGDELHLAFNFPPLYTRWRARDWRRQVEAVVKQVDAVGGWPTWVLSNHDNPRHRTRYGGSERRARAAAVLLLTLRGAPFVYYGEELGLEDAVVPAVRVVDPGGRDGCRSPLPWDASPGHGWAGAEPWLPWSPEPESRNVAALVAQESSILHLYRRLLAARRASPALATGSWAAIEAPAGVLAYERRHGDDRRAVVVNFTAEPVDLHLEERWRVEVDSDGLVEGEVFRSRLPGNAAVVLTPVE